MGQKANPNSLQVGKKKNWCTLFSEKKLRDTGIFSQTFELEIFSYINHSLNKQGFCIQDYRLHYCENIFKIFVSVFSTEHLFKNNTSNINTKSFVKLKSNQTRKSIFLVNVESKKNLKKDFINTLIKSISERLHNKKIMITVCYVNAGLNLSYAEKNLVKKNLLSLRRFKNQFFFLENFSAAFVMAKEHQFSNILLKVLVYYVKTIKGIKFFLKFLKKSLTLLIESPKNTTKGVKIKIKGRLTKSGRAKSLLMVVGDVPCHSSETLLKYSSANSQNQNGSYSVKLWVVSE